jgi:hypothetical protein
MMLDLFEAARRCNLCRAIGTETEDDIFDRPGQMIRVRRCVDVEACLDRMAPATARVAA